MRRVFVITPFGGWESRRPRLRRTPAQQAVVYTLRGGITGIAAVFAGSTLGGVHLAGYEAFLFVGFLFAAIHMAGFEELALGSLVYARSQRIVRPLPLFGTALGALVIAGLFVLAVNTANLAITAWLAGKFDAIEFAIDGFWDAVLGALVISLLARVVMLLVDLDAIGRAVTSRDFWADGG